MVDKAMAEDSLTCRYAFCRQRHLVGQRAADQGTVQIEQNCIYLVNHAIAAFVIEA
jgi:hypothetical protein